MIPRDVLVYLFTQVFKGFPLGLAVCLFIWCYVPMSLEVFLKITWGVIAASIIIDSVNNDLPWQKDSS